MTEDVQPRWPRRSKPYTLLALLLSLACGFFMVRAFVHTARPLQRFYFGQYLRISTIGDGSLLPSVHKAPTDGKKPHVIVSVDGVPADNEAFDHAPGAITKPVLRVDPARFYLFLHDYIYDRKTVWEWLLWPLLGTGFVGIILLSGGAYLDRRHEITARNGRRLRGPALVSRFHWNWSMRFSGGMSIKTVDRRNPIELLMGRRGYELLVKEKDLPKHKMISGVTGSGKSTMLHYEIEQIRARGDRAVIYDPDGEFAEAHLDPATDLIINVKDERTVFYDLKADCGDEAETFSIGTAMFPPRPNRQDWFDQHARAIVAYLLAAYKPSAAELALWMSHPEMIDERVKGTEHEHTLTKNAAPQRAGVLGTMNEFARALRMLPPESDGRPRWSVADWVKNGKGFVFITTTSDTIEAVRPLITMWLDLLLLKLQSTANKQQRRTWVVLDEVASLNKLPQLHAALTRQRKSGNPIILGLQGIAQIADNYGEKSAQVMLSQPYTNIVLRTRERKAAEHMEGMIGKVQLERVSEHRPANTFGRGSRSYTTSRVFDPLVSADEIQELPDLTGYAFQLDKIVKFRFKPYQVVKRAPRLIEREIPMIQSRPPVAPEEETEESTPAATRSGTPQQSPVAVASGVTSVAADLSIFGA